MNQLSRTGCHLRRAISNVLRVASFCDYSGSRTSPPSSTSASPDSLHSRVWKSAHSSISVVKVIEKWLDEGNQITQSELGLLIKNLRRHRRHLQALQMSEWMRDQSCYHDSPGQIAVRLALISKVRGLEEAEEVFEAIPDAMRSMEVYGALLHCYTQHLCMEKAEATMEKMRKLGFLKSSFPCNMMLTLYHHTNNHEKLDNLVKEMEEKKIKSDFQTYDILLNAYGAASRISEMEQLLNKLERDTVNKVGWNSCAIVANAYLKAGEKETAKAMMKKIEGLVINNSAKFRYEDLIRMYTNAGEMDEVYRIWDLYKSMGKMLNSGYLRMISSLVKLDSIDGAEKIWEEWCSRGLFYDIRILNQMIVGYSRKGLWEKAEECVSKVTEGGGKPGPITWSCLAIGYCDGGKIEMAVETLKKAVSEPSCGLSGQKLNLGIPTVAACIKHLKGMGEIEEAQEILEKVKANCHFPDAALNKLVAYLKSESQDAMPIDGNGDADLAFDDGASELKL